MLFIFLSPIMLIPRRVFNAFRNQFDAQEMRYLKVLDSLFLRVAVQLR